MAKFNVYLNNNFLFYQLFGIEPTTADLTIPVEVKGDTTSLSDVFYWGNSSDSYTSLSRSLSVGDVIQHIESNCYFIIENHSFRLIRIKTPSSDYQVIHNPVIGNPSEARETDDVRIADTVISVYSLSPVTSSDDAISANKVGIASLSAISSITWKEYMSLSMFYYKYFIYCNCYTSYA